MKLKSIELKNIRSYKFQKIYFSDNILLMGDIGSGKSSILQSIEFALFGIQRGINNSSSLLRIDEDEAYVILELKDNKNTYYVKRTLKKNKNSISQGPGYFGVNGKNEEFMPSEINHKVLNILGYYANNQRTNSLIYRYSVYATQEQMKKIITDKPEERMNILRIVFGIDRYKTIIENSTIVVKDLKKKNEYLKGTYHDLTEKKSVMAEQKIKKDQINENLKEMKEIDKQKNKNLQEKESEYDELNKEYTKTLQLKSRYENTLELIQSNKKEKKNLQEDNEKLSQEIENIKQTISNIEIKSFDYTYEQIKSRINQINDEISSKKEQLQSSKNKIDDFSEKIKEIKEKINQKKSLQKQIKELEQNLSKKQDENKLLQEKFDKRQELRSSIEKLKLEIKSEEKNLDEEKNKISKIENINTCPTCYQDVDKDHKDKIRKKSFEEQEKISEKIKSLKTEMKEKKDNLNQTEDLEDSLKKSQEEINKIKVKLSTTKEKITELEQMESRYGEISKKLATERSNLKKIQEYDFDKKKNEIEKLLKKEEEIRKNDIAKQKKSHLVEIEKEKNNNIEKNIKKIKSLEEKYSELEKQAEDLKQKTKGIDKKKQEILKKSQELKSIREDYNKFHGKHTALISDFNNVDKQIKDLEQEINKKEENKKKHDWHLSLKSWIEDFIQPLVKNIEANVLRQIYLEFNHKFRHWFSTLIEDESYFVSIDDTFTPKIQQNGIDIDVESLSGGERTSLAFAYRIALNRIINEMIGVRTGDILILDEPTEGFSSEQLDKVREVLYNLDIPQLVLVSHEQKMDSIVDNVINIEKINGESKIVQ
ncbi:MAG: AAA family ATPase [Nanobdellota archaeon]